MAVNCFVAPTRMLALDGVTDTDVSVGGAELLETRPRHPMFAIRSEREKKQKRTESNRRGRAAIGRISKKCESAETAGGCQKSARQNIMERNGIAPTSTEVPFSCQIFVGGCSAFTDYEPVNRCPRTGHERRRTSNSQLSLIACQSPSLEKGHNVSSAG